MSEVNLVTALAAAQGEFKNPARNKTVRVKTRVGGEYTFSYATLDSIMDMLRDPLAKHGLAVTHELRAENGLWLCATVLRHASGESVECAVPVIVAEAADAQGWGSALTYARRYGLCTLLAIAADEDDDANSACGNHAQEAARTAAKAPPKRASRSKWGNGEQPAEPPKAAPAEKTWSQMTQDEKTAYALEKIAAARKEADPVQAKAMLDKIAKAGMTPLMLGEENFERVTAAWDEARKDIENETSGT